MSPERSRRAFLAILAQPTFVIIAVFYVYGFLREHQRTKWVYHYGKFFGFGFAYAFFYRSWVRTVRYAAWVQGYHASLHIFSAHKIAIYVVQHFIAIDVAVVVGRRYSQRMVIVEAWHKGANHKILGFKRLMHGRWLVHSPRYWLKIVDRKCVGIVVTVPAHGIEGVRGVGIRVNQPLLFYVNQKIALFVVGF